MIRWRSFPIILSLALGLPDIAAAQDPQAGFQLAQHWCAGCHEIGTRPVDNVVSPPFLAIAKMPSTTAISLNAFLQSSHNRMPNLSLSQQEIADISAYILSLKDKQAGGLQNTARPSTKGLGP